MSGSIPVSVIASGRAILAESDRTDPLKHLKTTPRGSVLTPASSLATDAVAPYKLGFDTISSAELVRRVEAMGAPRWLFRGVWAADDYGVVAGSAKAGKTWTAIDAAVSAASGTPWLGRFESDLTGPVLYFLGEGGERKAMRRAQAVCRERELNFSDLEIHWVMRPPNLSNGDAVEMFRQTVERIKPVLTIIDPFYLSGGEKADSSKLNSMGEVLSGPQRICQDAKSALMVAAHTNRSKGAKGLAQISGAGLAEWLRVCVILNAKKETINPISGRTSIEISVEMIGDEIAGAKLTMTRDVWEDDSNDLSSPMHYQLTWTNELKRGSESVIPPKLSPTLDVLRKSGEWLTKKEIEAELKEAARRVSEATRRVSEATLRNHLKELEERGLIEKEQRGNTNFYRVATSPIDEAKPNDIGDLI